MPPGTRINREDIIEAGVAVVRAGGYEALSARRIAAELGCSTQPLFSNFAEMKALFEAIVARAWQIYSASLERDMQAGVYRPYLASGMSYIMFACNEPELFRLLFMRDRSNEATPDAMGDIDDIVRLISDSTGLSLEDARALHVEMWVFVHGIAVMMVTHFMPWDVDTMSAMLSDVYLGVLMRFKERAQPNTPTDPIGGKSE